VAAPPRAVSFTVSGPEPARRAASTLPAFFPDFSRSDAGGLQPEPLFVPRWTRAILSTALSVRVQTGMIDLAETVRRLRAASRSVSGAPPGRPNGADRARAHRRRREHAAVLADEVHITSELGQVVGISALETLKFVGTPLKRAGRGPLRTGCPTRLRRQGLPSCSSPISESATPDSRRRQRPFGTGSGSPT